MLVRLARVSTAFVGKQEVVQNGLRGTLGWTALDDTALPRSRLLARNNFRIADIRPEAMPNG